MNKISKRQRNRRPLGQHFLHDEAVLTRIASLVKPSKNIVLEIGPGTGNLTELLLDKGFEVYAIEIDSRLVKKLANKSGNFMLINRFVSMIDALFLAKKWNNEHNIK